MECPLANKMQAALDTQVPCCAGEQAPVYAPHLALLAKLLFLSSAIHQLIFVLASSLPFAVGQVQDVGLIFLSAMASSVAGASAPTPWEDHAPQT